MTNALPNDDQAGKQPEDQASQESALVGQSVSRRRVAYWTFAAVVTGVLATPAYNAWVQVSEAQGQLARAQQNEERLRKEHTEWATLAEQQRVMRESVFQHKRDVTEAIKSFSRDELHGAMRRAVEAANPKKAIVLNASNMMWGNSTWVYVPEAGHYLSLRISVKDLKPKDCVGEPFEDQDLRLELAPKQLYKFKMWIEERYKTKDCVLRVQMDDEMLLEHTFLLDPRSSTSSGGARDLVLIPPRVLTSNWAWSKSPVDHYRRGIWCTLEEETFGLYPTGESQENREVKFACTMGIATTKSLFAPKSTKYALDKHGLPFTEVTDPESPFYGHLEIKGP